jgi:hypothetical protein
MLAGLPGGMPGGRKREREMGQDNSGEGPANGGIPGIDWVELERALFAAAGEHQDAARARGISIEADKIVSMILTPDMPKADVEIAIRGFRRRVLEEFPGREELFDGLYLGRFRRIWEQFRGEEL